MSLVWPSQYIQELAALQRGAKVTYQGNVVKCSLHRTFAENLTACLEALTHVTGETIEEMLELHLQVEAYRSS